LRSALIDSITHQLRTPITSLQAAATMLKSDPEMDRSMRVELATVIEEESIRLDHLVRDAVQMAQLEANAVHLQLTETPLGGVLEQAVEDAHSALRDHEVTLEVLEPPVPVMLDRELMRRVFQHLLENAGHYTPQGTEIRLTACCTEEKIHFSVEDNGPGMEQKDLEHIFDKFYRGNTSRSVNGTGMGLAIVRAILNAHGGGITVDSRRELGTTFRLWIPKSKPVRRT
jgi:two-component system sensor histidine kinase KdpD